DRDRARRHPLRAPDRARGLPRPLVAGRLAARLRPRRDRRRHRRGDLPRATRGAAERARSAAVRVAVRVLVLTAEEGEGHRSIGAALAAELKSHDVDVVVLDVFQEGFSKVVAFFSRDLYRLQLRWFA